uniref:Uncharacterized protein n=1 Tax=Triticum urartu TaxID=4572 RepID=A0A8R7U6K6_TRIUA
PTHATYPPPLSRFLSPRITCGRGGSHTNFTARRGSRRSEEKAAVLICDLPRPGRWRRFRFVICHGVGGGRSIRSDAPALLRCTSSHWSRSADEADWPQVADPWI